MSFSDRHKHLYFGFVGCVDERMKRHIYTSNILEVLELKSLRPICPELPVTPEKDVYG